MQEHVYQEAGMTRDHLGVYHKFIPGSDAYSATS